jgi:hypothetical protein
MTIVPLRLYQYYGDIDILRYKHQFMVEYVEYLVNRAGGAPYLLDGGLGDWESLGESTPSSISARALLIPLQRHDHPQGRRRVIWLLPGCQSYGRS